MNPELERTPDEKRALRLRLTENALRHSKTCTCGVCRMVFPERYRQCDACEAIDLKENMFAWCGYDGEVEGYRCEPCFSEGKS